MLYLFVPATVISLDRLTVDLASTSLAVAFALFVYSGERRKLYLVLALAPLCRETGFALAAACCWSCLSQKQLRSCLFWASTVLPAVAWIGFVRWKLGPAPAAAPGALTPFRGLWEALIDPAHYSFSVAINAAVHAFDYLYMLGLILAFALALRYATKAANNPIFGACLLWALIGFALPRGSWVEAYGMSRVFSPLLLLQFVEGAAGGLMLSRLPLLLVSPRTWIQLLPQLEGVLRGMVAG